jgi:hypothetical protein
MGSLNYFQRRMQARVLREREPELPQLDDRDRVATIYSVTAFSDAGVRSAINVLAHSPEQAIELAHLRWSSLGNPVPATTEIKVDPHTFQSEQMKRAILSFESFEEYELRRQNGAL